VEGLGQRHPVGAGAGGLVDHGEGALEVGGLVGAGIGLEEGDDGGGHGQAYTPRAHR
jgi:hypothetical protein